MPTSLEMQLVSRVKGLFFIVTHNLLLFKNGVYLESFAQCAELSFSLHTQAFCNLFTFANFHMQSM